MSILSTRSPAPGVVVEVGPIHRELEQRFGPQSNLPAIKVPPGWMPLVLKMLTEVESAYKKAPKIGEIVSSVTQMDSELCVFYNTRNRGAYSAIQKYISDAKTTCEICGWPGDIEEINIWAMGVRCPVCTFLGDVGKYKQ